MEHTVEDSKKMSELTIKRDRLKRKIVQLSSSERDLRLTMTDLSKILNFFFETVHFYRDECYPLATFSEEELRDVSVMIALQIVLAERLPSQYGKIFWNFLKR